MFWALIALSVLVLALVARVLHHLAELNDWFDDSRGEDEAACPSQPAIPHTPRTHPADR